MVSFPPVSPARPYTPPLRASDTQNIIKIKTFCPDNTNNQTIIVKQTLDLIKITVNQNYVQYNAIYCNPLNAKLNPIYHLLALLGAHHILHFNRVGVKPTKGIAMGSPVSSTLLEIYLRII